MTDKQRAKIYRQAAEMICDGNATFCCKAIAKIVLGAGGLYEDITGFDYPELFMFEYLHDQHDWAGWWTSGFNGHCTEARILALLLSEQMALNP